MQPAVYGLRRSAAAVPAETYTEELQTTYLTYCTLSCVRLVAGGYALTSLDTHTIV